MARKKAKGFTAEKYDKGLDAKGLRRYDRGESTAAIRNALNLPESTLQTIRKDRKKITAKVKAGAGSGSTKVSSGQSNIMVRRDKILVTWMDHRKCQGVNVTFDYTKNKAKECFNYLKEKEIQLKKKVVPQKATRKETTWSSPTRLAVAKESRKRAFIVTTRRGQDDKSSKVGPHKKERTLTRSHAGGDTGRSEHSSSKERLSSHNTK